MPEVDRLLHIRNGQSVARGFRPIHFDVDVEALRDALGKDGAHLRKRRENLLNLRADLLDALQSSALESSCPSGVLIPVSSMSRRFSTGMVQVFVRPGNWSFASIS